VPAAELRLGCCGQQARCSLGAAVGGAPGAVGGLITTRLPRHITEGDTPPPINVQKMTR